MDIEDALLNENWLSENCELNSSVTVDCWIKKDSDIGFSMIEGRRLKIIYYDKNISISVFKTAEELPIKKGPETKLKVNAKNYDVAYLESLDFKEHRDEEMIKSYTIRFLKFKNVENETVKKILGSKNFILNPKASSTGCLGVLVILISFFHFLI